MSVALAAGAFVVTHELMSHPLRAGLVRRLGPGGFMGAYSAVAAVTLGATIVAWLRAPAEAPLWQVGAWLWAAVTLVMLLASVLLMGSLVGNPALAGPRPSRDDPPDEARGVYALTRHPMMWSVALWAFCHAAVVPVAKSLVLAAAMAALALLGAAMQDRKKRALEPARWSAWEARTSFWPGAAIAGGRARLSGFGTHALAGGLLVWLAATWAHGPLAGCRVGLWSWLLA